MIPDFTIITPSYNYAHFIDECLKSVAEQKGVTYEHLVIDGGSTDGTADVVANYPDVDFVSEPDEGMSDAINKGFLRAKGKWVMWLNTDDKLHPGALERVLKFADSHEQADVIFGGWHFVDKEGQLTKKMPLFPLNKKMLTYLGCYIGSTATFFRRETVIDEGHLLNINFRYVMDGEYYNRLVHEGKKFVYLPRYLADFRLHGNNLSKKNFNSGSVDDLLRLQKQFAESRAIKRAYGHAISNDDNINTLVDSVFYLFYRLLKPALKIANKWRMEN